MVDTLGLTNRLSEPSVRPQGEGEGSYLSGRSSTTRDPAPICVPLPTLMFPRRQAPAPSKTPLPILIRDPFVHMFVRMEERDYHHQLSVASILPVSQLVDELGVSH